MYNYVLVVVAVVLVTVVVVMVVVIRCSRNINDAYFPNACSILNCIVQLCLQ